jgi:hypothetical protein
MNQGVAPGINTGIPIGRNGPGIDTSGSPNSRQGPNSGAPMRNPFASLQLASAKAKETSRVKPQAPPKHPPGTPFVATNYADYIGGGVIGNGSCAVLPQVMIPAVGKVDTWRKGDAVVGNQNILPGTVVATFDVYGLYPNKDHDNHAAIYISQITKDVKGVSMTVVKVFDQWKGRKPSVRPMITLGQLKKAETTESGVTTIYINPSDNASALSIVVH